MYLEIDGSQKLHLNAYTDADWAADLRDRKSTTGMVILLRKAPVTWISRKRKTVAVREIEFHYLLVKAAIVYPFSK